METNKVPIFAHIPKCGGCYIASRMQKICKKTYGEDLKFISFKNKSGQIIYSIFGFIGEQKDVKNLDIKAIVLSPAGFSLLKIDFFEKLLSVFNKTPEYFTVLRNPLESEESLYFYLGDEMSAYEQTHLAFKSTCFEDYIKNEMSDSWLIRKICGIDNTENIKEENFEQVKAILTKFTVCTNMNKINEMIDSIFIESGFDITDTFIQEKINARRDQIKKNFKIDDFSEEIQKIFNSKKIHENRLFHFFSS